MNFTHFGLWKGKKLWKVIKKFDPWCRRSKTLMATDSEKDLENCFNYIAIRLRVNEKKNVLAGMFVLYLWWLDQYLLSSLFPCRLISEYNNQ